MSTCKVDGCERNKKSLGMCEMHYFRFRRYGTTETLRKGKAKQKVMHSNGYVLIYDPSHPLAKCNYVYEHRKVIWDECGQSIPPCQLCGKDLTWQTCHIDHVDNNKANNARDNLRVACPSCNIGRFLKERSSNYRFAWEKPVTVNGITLSAAAWARQPDVFVSPSTINSRLKRGLDPHTAVYGPKKTHNGNKTAGRCA